MNPSAVKLYESREFPHELNLPVPRRREEKVMRSLFRRFRQEISLSLSLSLSLFPRFLRFSQEGRVKSRGAHFSPSTPRFRKLAVRAGRASRRRRFAD